MINLRETKRRKTFVEFLGKQIIIFQLAIRRNYTADKLVQMPNLKFVVNACIIFVCMRIILLLAL